MECKIVAENGLPESGVAVFESDGRLLIVEFQTPGVPLPDMFRVELEEGLIAEVIKDEHGHRIDDADLPVFQAQFFG